MFRPLWRKDAFAEIYLAWREDGRNAALATLRDFFIRRLAATPARPAP